MTSSTPQQRTIAITTTYHNVTHVPCVAKNQILSLFGVFVILFYPYIFFACSTNSQQTRVSLQFHYECITDLLAVCLVHRVLLSECVKVSSYHIIHSFIHLSNQAANHSSIHLPIHPNKPFTTIQIHSIHC